MAHKADYELVLHNENNELILIQYALWKDKRLDITKYNFTRNLAYIRWGNVDYHSLGGWLVQFPNEKPRNSYYSYYGEERTKLYDYCTQPTFPNGLKYGTLLTSWDRVKELILETHSEFKYLLKKIDFEKTHITIFTLFELMRMWYEHPSEVENLAFKGFYTLALNKQLYRLGKAKKMEIIKAVKDFTGNECYCTLKNIREYINSGMKFDEW